MSKEKEGYFVDTWLVDGWHFTIFSNFEIWNSLSMKVPINESSNTWTNLNPNLNDLTGSNLIPFDMKWSKIPLSHLSATLESSDDDSKDDGLPVKRKSGNQGNLYKPQVCPLALYLYSCLTCNSTSSIAINEKEVQRPLSSGERPFGDSVAQQHRLE